MAHKSTVRHILVTGSPGVGKTTLVCKVVEKLKQDPALLINGFYTKEVRHQGFREGFDVVTLGTSKCGTLARKSGMSPTEPSGRMPMVGQYSVDIRSFEDVALPTLQVSGSSASLLVVDEIGKMELFSNKFSSIIRQIFDAKRTVILATVPISKGKPIKLIEDLKAREDCTLITVTKSNRENLVDEVAVMLLDSYRLQNDTGTHS